MTEEATTRRTRFDVGVGAECVVPEGDEKPAMRGGSLT
jgi:hypothetical protein